MLPICFVVTICQQNYHEAKGNKKGVFFFQHSNTCSTARKRAGLGDLPAVQRWQEGSPCGRLECQGPHLQNQYPCSVPTGANGSHPAGVEGEVIKENALTQHFSALRTRVQSLLSSLTVERLIRYQLNYHTSQGTNIIFIKQRGGLINVFLTLASILGVKIMHSICIRRSSLLIFTTSFIVQYLPWSPKWML